jgi:microcystin degradation protein MlrC
MRADRITALTPGGVDQDLERLPFKRIQRPMFPFDKDMIEPDLNAKLVPLSGEVPGK